MDEGIKREAQNYIKNNCKYYKNYFCSKDLNMTMKFAVRILENKLLNLNRFCYYLDYSLAQIFMNTDYYLKLSKKNRKKLEFYQRSVVKIYLHLNSIFSEINNIKRKISTR